MHTIWHAAAHAISTAYHAVGHAAAGIYHATTHALSTAAHAVGHAVQATASFVANHAPVIVSTVVGVATFAGCAAAFGIETAGVGVIGCAALWQAGLEGERAVQLQDATGHPTGRETGTRSAPPHRSPSSAGHVAGTAQPP